jgi:hypothetical protein
MGSPHVRNPYHECYHEQSGHHGIDCFQGLSVVHPGVLHTPEPPSLEVGQVGVSEVEWSNGDTLQASGLSGWPAFVMYGATRVKFKLYHADAVLVISFWNTGEVFAP